MKTQTERVDVLAVMQADAFDAAKERQWNWDAQVRVKASEDARAAAAELIDVCTSLLSYRHGTYPMEGYLRDNDASRAQLDALETVITRIGDGK